MKFTRMHEWDLGIAEEKALQSSLSERVSLHNEISTVRHVAGVDISVRRTEGIITGSVVLLDYPGLTVQEVSTVTGELTFPYIPGLLSFREMPAALEAFEKLRGTPDIVIADGQGFAHPRRFGLACHLGVFLDIPVIGCAKSRLCGTFTEPGIRAGSSSRLTDNGEAIGTVLRTKTGVKPLFVSPGYKTDMENAVQWIMNCCRGYRLPEPSRFAHLAAGGNLTIRNTRT
jgi:deoxyribonuclease V